MLPRGFFVIKLQVWHISWSGPGKCFYSKTWGKCRITTYSANVLHNVLSYSTVWCFTAKSPRFSEQPELNTVLGPHLVWAGETNPRMGNSGTGGSCSNNVLTLVLSGGNFISVSSSATCLSPSLLTKQDKARHSWQVLYFAHRNLDYF